MDELQQRLGILPESKPEISPFDKSVPPKRPLSKKELAKKEAKDKKIAEKKPPSKLPPGQK